MIFHWINLLVKSIRPLGDIKDIRPKSRCLNSPSLVCSRLSEVCPSPKCSVLSGFPRPFFGEVSWTSFMMDAPLLRRSKNICRVKNFVTSDFLVTYPTNFPQKFYMIPFSYLLNCKYSNTSKKIFN